jgi:hypothetical protein
MAKPFSLVRKDKVTLMPLLNTLGNFCKWLCQEMTGGKDLCYKNAKEEFGGNAVPELIQDKSFPHSLVLGM